ncbi:MAG TPA: SRPBCC family protein [Ohtaekwangia sp.]|nr:SRPBCC family protein [Ohtaekwangia sp.]
MDTLIVILAIIGALVALILIAALFVKKAYLVQRNIIVHKPASEVFNYVKFLKNQDHYSKWVMADPGMKKEFKGTDGTVGFVYGWNSTDKGVGEGEQEIKGIRDGEMDVEVRFVRPFENVGITKMIVEPVSDGKAQVTWGMKGSSKYPLNLMNPVMDKILGKDLEISLNNLKTILEKSNL